MITIQSVSRLLMIILLATTIAGCAMSSENEKLPVQGDWSYGIEFDISDAGPITDWDNSWFYTYVPGGGDRRLGQGGIHGYKEYYTLTMNFAFADGRKFREVVDIEQLMRELSAREKIFDNRKTNDGGVAFVGVEITDSELIIFYQVSERILKPRYTTVEYKYPLFRKSLLKEQ